MTRIYNVDANQAENAYFHKLNDEQYAKLLERNTTWAELQKTHSQPLWCHYPSALDGPMGCWSLVYRPMKSESYCMECEYHKEAA